MAEFLTGFSNILWGAPVLILLGIVGLLYGIRTKFFQIRKMGYILKNTAGEMFKKGGGEALAKVHNLPFLGAIPLDPATVIAADRGEPIVRMVEDTAAKRAFLKLAETVREKIGD